MFVNRSGRSGALALLLLVACAGCKSEPAASQNADGGRATAGAGGTGGVGGAAGSGGSRAIAGAGGSAGCPGAKGGAGGGIDLLTGCSNAYVVPHYSEDTCGLCDPGVSTQCSNATGCDWALSYPNVECTPDGTACVAFGAFCANGKTECGWDATPVCHALAAAAEKATGGSVGGVCARDKDCGAGHYCNLRLANRMFCDNTFVAYAKDYCIDGGAGSGTDGGIDAGADASAADSGP